MGYVDPQTIHNPATGTQAPASWGDAVRDCLEFLVAPPQCSFGHSTTQNIATATFTALSGDTENYDTDAMHDTVTNNSRATVNTAGKYQVNVVVNFTASGAGNRRSVRLLVDGSTVYELVVVPPVGGGNVGTRIAASRTLALTAGQYVECQALQDTGGNLATQLIEMSARYVSR